MKRIILALAFILLTFGSVLANQPGITTIHLEFDNTPREDIVCNGATLLQYGTIDIRTTIFFDNEGTPVRAATHVNANTGLINPANNRIWSHEWHQNIFVDFTSGTTRGVGLLDRLTIPQQGVLLLDAGVLTFDMFGNVIFEAGPHPIHYAVDGYNDWDAALEIICSHLG